MAKAKTYETHAVGKRKTSVARVYLTSGTGKITINKREFVEYFNMASSRYMVMQPFNQLKIADKYDVIINVCGGGITGQAGAIRLGISRAILKLDPTARPELRKAGFLTRDARKVERKKYGVRGARRAFQFSKR